jgi:hypothetical protein
MLWFFIKRVGAIGDGVAFVSVYFRFYFSRVLEKLNKNEQYLPKLEP